MTSGDLAAVRRTMGHDPASAPPRVPRAHRRRRPVRAHRPAEQGRARLARPGLAHRRALRPGRPRPRAGRAPPPARGVRRARRSPGAASATARWCSCRTPAWSARAPGHAALLFGAVPGLVAVVAALAGRGRERPARLARVRRRARRRRPRRRLGRRHRRRPATASCCCRRSARRRSSSPRHAARRPRSDRGHGRADGRRGARRAPFALAGGSPPAPGAASAGDGRRGLALVVAGTLLPFAFFAFGQARVRPEVVGAFANLEPLVGAGVAVLAFGDAFGPLQALGAGAILAGIAISSGRPDGPGAPAARLGAPRLSRRPAAAAPAAPACRRCRRRPTSRCPRAAAREPPPWSSPDSVVVVRGVVVVVVREPVDRRAVLGGRGRRRGGRRRAGRAAAVVAGLRRARAVARAQRPADRPMLSPEIALAASADAERGDRCRAAARVTRMRGGARGHRSSMTVVTGSRPAAARAPRRQRQADHRPAAPPSGRLAIVASPPQRRASTRTIVRPRPLPRGRSARELPRTKRSKTRSSSPGSRPGPGVEDGDAAVVARRRRARPRRSSAGRCARWRSRRGCRGSRRRPRARRRRGRRHCGRGARGRRRARRRPRASARARPRRRP